METEKKKIITLKILRIALGWVFLWAFLDKTFGFGFTTEPAKSWLAGGSPASGFLTHATRGPFAGVFEAMAGLLVVDWLFMLGLLGIGAALILGKAMRLACWSGMAMMLLMWFAVLPPEHNPIVDKHIVYTLVLYLLLITNRQKPPKPAS